MGASEPVPAAELDNQRSRARTPAQQAHIERVLRLARPGDIITHTRCMGLVEEHRFTGLDGPWMCGRATTDTARLAAWGSDRAHGARGWTNDIAPTNVTHINRVPVTPDWPGPQQDGNDADTGHT